MSNFRQQLSEIMENEVYKEGTTVYILGLAPEPTEAVIVGLNDDWAGVRLKTNISAGKKTVYQVHISRIIVAVEL